MANGAGSCRIRIRFGCRVFPQYNDPYLYGSYDEVRIYGKALSEQVILDSL